MQDMERTCADEQNGRDDGEDDALEEKSEIEAGAILGSKGIVVCCVIGHVVTCNSLHKRTRCTIYESFHCASVLSSRFLGSSFKCLMR